MPVLNSIVLVGVIVYLVLLPKSVAQTNKPFIPPQKASSGNEPYHKEAQKNFTEYINSYQKVRLEYPSDWIKAEYDQNVFVEFKKGDTWDFNVVNFSMTSDPKLEDYKKNTIDGISKYKEYKLLESKDVTLAGLPGFKVVFMATFNKPYKIMQLYALKQNHGYSLTYRSADPDKFDAQLPDVQKMIDSFQILD